MTQPDRARVVEAPGELHLPCGVSSRSPQHQRGPPGHRGSNMAGWESSISMEVYGELSIAMFTER